MLNALLTGIVAGLVVIGGFLLIFFLIKRRISRVISQFVSAPDPDTPSPLATMVDNTAQIIAKHAAMQVKTSLMGLSSVDAKMEKRMEGAVMTDIFAAKNPLLGMLASFPNVQKLISRKPEYLAIASQILGSFGKSNGSKPPDNAAGTQSKLTLD